MIRIFIYVYLNVSLFLGNKAHRCFTQNVNKPYVLTQELKVGKTKSDVLRQTSKLDIILPISLSQAWKLAIVQILLFLLDLHLLSAPTYCLHMATNTILLNSK